MPRATCRCGQALNVPADGTDRIVCPSCGAKVRIRRPAAAAVATEEDGFVRFNCPCGRRLKVSADASPRPTHGKCPDCGQVVPVPSTSRATRDPEAPTVELSAADRARIEEWSQRHIAAQERRPSSTHVLPTTSAPTRSEAGMRICPGCGKPVHMGASLCRACGIPVPKR